MVGRAVRTSGNGSVELAAAAAASASSCGGAALGEAKAAAWLAERTAWCAGAVDPCSIRSVPVEYPAAALFVAVDFLPLARFVSMFESDGVCVCAYAFAMQN